MSVENWTALFAQGATESQSKPCTKSPLQSTFTPLTCELILGAIAFEHHPLEKMMPVAGDLIPKKKSTCATFRSSSLSLHSTKLFVIFCQSQHSRNLKSQYTNRFTPPQFLLVHRPNPSES